MSHGGSNPVPADDAGAELQFDRAVLTDTPAADAVCAGCQAPLVREFYRANSLPWCSQCVQSAKQQSKEPGLRQLLRATLYGLGAAALGTATYYAVLALSGYEIGFLAVLVGWLVGKAVRKGGEARGGWKLQTIAMVFTYLSIVVSYIPMVIQGAMDRAATRQQEAGKAGQTLPKAQTTTVPVAPLPPGEAVATLGLGVVLLVGLALVIPFLQGFQSIIGLFIIAIGLYEAWKINRREQPEFSGPHPISTTPIPAA